MTLIAPLTSHMVFLSLTLSFLLLTFAPRRGVNNNHWISLDTYLCYRHFLHLMICLEIDWLINWLIDWLLKEEVEEGVEEEEEEVGGLFKVVRQNQADKSEAHR